MKTSGLIRHLILFVVLLFGGASAWATTYYVCDDGTDCNAGDGSGWVTGNDGNNGTSRATPWKTIDYAEEQMSPGDTAIVGDGTYNTGSAEDSNVVVFVQNAGTSGNYITFQSENLHGANITGKTYGIYIDCDDSVAYIRFEGFELSALTEYGVYGKDNGGTPFVRATNIEFYQCKIHNIGEFGINLREADDVVIDSCLIYDINKASPNLYHGIYISDNTDGWLVKNNIVYDCTNGWPLHLYLHGDGDAENHVIVNNTFIDENSDRTGGILLWSGTNITVRNNIFDIVAGSGDYGIDENGSTTGTIEYNLTNATDICEDCGSATVQDNSTSGTLGFTSHATRDYTLGDSSDAIDSGTASSAPDVDYAGVARPQGSADDIGAYEDISQVTPIARTNVIPRQRIAYGSTFNFGVIAFSKAGIDRVDFAISGQGYSGGTKSSSTMAQNTRVASSSPGWAFDGVWEYYVEISSSEFTTDGAITVTPTVYGDDAGSRALDAVTLIVEATGAGTQYEAWISPTGSDVTGEVGNQAKPYASVDGAVQDIEVVNGGDCDNAVIYFEEGTYSSISSGTTTTTSEWLTLTRASGADIDSTIIDDGGTSFNTNYLKFEGLTVKSNGSDDYIVVTDAYDYWFHNCKVIGSGSLTSNSSPIKAGVNAFYSSCYLYDMNRALGDRPRLARGLYIKQIGEDIAQNCDFLVNLRVDAVDPGLSTYWHSDLWQTHTQQSDNRIIYNVFATDMHYQGIIATNLSYANDGVAFVNVFIEMREPGRPGQPGGDPHLQVGLMFGDNPWTHLLIWHCSFPYSPFAMNGFDSNDLEDSSIFGSIFWEYKENSAGTGNEPSFFANGNAEGNDFLYSHFKSSKTDASIGASDSSKSPDSGASATASTGGNNHPECLDLTDTTTYVDFGEPLAGSGLTERIPSASAVIPADVWGTERTGDHDIGALEISVTEEVGGSIREKRFGQDKWGEEEAVTRWGI